MTTGLRAIETRYKGYRFRSRLEARWAVVFDALDVRWEYEKEGFDLGTAGRYLPDFWLPEHACWIEIKGSQPTETERRKAAALATTSGFPVYIFPCGFPFADSVEDVRCSVDGCDGAYAFLCSGGEDNYYRWCVCPDCGRVGIQFDGRSDRLPCKECYSCWSARIHADLWAEGCPTHGTVVRTGCRRRSQNGDKAYTAGHPKLVAAFNRGRAARFEHRDDEHPR
jgi:hypothetical protein